MNIIPGNLSDARIADLLRRHHSMALAVTPRESAHALDVDGLKAEGIEFYAAWEDETLLGIGALRRHSAEAAEIKSMHTAQGERGKGVGAAMVRFLLDRARASGFRRVSLETGAMDYFAPARALYHRHGFTECDAFPPYKPDDNSVFMTLEL